MLGIKRYLIQGLLYVHYVFVGSGLCHFQTVVVTFPSLLYNGYRVFPGGKLRQGRDADPSPPSSAEVKNRVELYIYSP
jgi:hypothetical protein